MTQPLTDDDLNLLRFIRDNSQAEWQQMKPEIVARIEDLIDRDYCRVVPSAVKADAQTLSLTEVGSIILGIVEIPAPKLKIFDRFPLPWEADHRSQDAPPKRRSSHIYAADSTPIAILVGPYSGELAELIIKAVNERSEITEKPKHTGQ